MLDRLFHALVESKNEAADDVLLDALRLGAEREQRVALAALLRRKTIRGLGGVISRYEALPEPLQLHILRNIKLFHPVLRECGRSDNTPLRLAALKLIALGRQGRLAYVLSENLHNSDETISKAACEAMVALARWVSSETRSLQKGEAEGSGFGVSGFAGATAQGSGAEEWTSGEDLNPEPRALNPAYQELMDQRPEIEAAVARAMDVHRGRHGQDLLRAALLLADWAGSKTLAILKTAKHGGQGPMVRRLQQPPASEHVEAFLLGASHGQLRSHFGVAFSHVAEAPVLDALLRKTHWLKDHQLQLCLHQVSRGVWWEEAQRGNFDISIYGYGATIPHVADYWNAGFKTGGGYNFYGYSNPAFDAIVAATARESDPAKLKALMDRGIEILDRDIPAIAWSNPVVPIAWWDNVKGHGTATKSVNFWEGMRDEIWWLDK